MIKSSYKNNIDYKDIFSTLCFLNKPKQIIEIGILDGYSLKSMADSVSDKCNINAFDIFEEFNGNCANKEKLSNIFKQYNNVNIQYGDFYNILNSFEDNSIDILHIDIANNGDVYEFALKEYIKKMNKNGIMILEGGSIERDNIEWMNKYNKRKIKPILDHYSSKFNILTIGTIPSITIISL